MTRPDTPNEFASLLDRCKNVPRDERAWQEFVGCYDRRAFALARRTLLGLGQDGDLNQQAADLRMELWVRLVRDQHAGLRRFQGDSEPALLSHFARTLRNLAIDRIRSKTALRRPTEIQVGESGFERLLSRIADPSLDPHDEVERSVLRQRASDVLRALWSSKPDGHRDVVICQLAWFERLSAARIASIRGFGLSRGGVEKVLQRGIEALRDRWVDGNAASGGGS